MLKTFYPHWNSRLTILAILSIFIAIVSWLYLPSTFFLKNKQENIVLSHEHAEPWMTVFVNGSFGSLLGFLNFSDVLQDNISGTLYRKTLKKMRDDSFFFRDQPILKRGLIHIEPTFDLEQTGGKKYAVYPLAKAYQEILNAIAPGKEKNYFYTFGWSGLVSQKSRRFESIRLYNALSEELEKFKQRGITPKIRLIGYSHGGNLCLNLDAVRKGLAFVAYDNQKNFSDNQDENESLQKMVMLLKNHTTKETAKNMIDQKIYDYVPTKNDLVIDQLILLGTPIQPETERFSYSDTFKKVYNFYSDGDMVQKIDWVTSKKPVSGQRISKDSSMHVVQARLIAEKTVENEKAPISMNVEQKIDEPIQGQSVLGELFSGRNLFGRETKDPTHKELWFISWNDEDPIFRSFLSPLPVVVLTPLLVHALETIPHSKDVDINLDATAENINVSVADYREQVIKGSIHIPQNVIQHIQEKITPWMPDDISQIADFEAAYKHIE